jgi:Flp pilus assembly protein TadD
VERVLKEAVCRRARVLLDLSRPSEALAVVRRALADNPNDPELLEIEGLCWLRMLDHAQALRALTRSIAEGPERAHPHYLYGFALREVGRSSEAAPALATALRLGPEEPVYLRALAELYADLGRHQEALALARRATELAPERSANHVTYGYVASQAGDKALARAEYERAVQLDPSDSAAWNNLGCLDLAAGRTLRARARFREALRLDPRGERARRNLALVVRDTSPVREWPDVLARLGDELVRGGAPKATLVALVIEAPEAGRVLVSGGVRGAALGGAAVAVALRAMGPAAALPLSVGALVAGVAWLKHRRSLPEVRARVRRVLADGRGQFERLWREWIDGASSRALRDQAVTSLVEKMALDLVETT